MQFIKQPKVIDRMYDYVNYDLARYDEIFKERDETDDRSIIRLASLQTNVVNLLKTNFGIDVTEIIDTSLYQCPVNEYTHCSIYPVYIRCADANHWFDKIHLQDWKRDMATDTESIANEAPTDVYATIKMGHGYTYACSPNDGTAELDYIAADLENGDTLVFRIYKWYNN